MSLQTTFKPSFSCFAKCDTYNVQCCLKSYFPFHAQFVQFMDHSVFEDFGKCSINIGNIRKLQLCRFSHILTLFCVSLLLLFFLTESVVSPWVSYFTCFGVDMQVTELGETHVGV